MEKEFLSETFQLDELDQKILNLLKQDAKLGTKEIASQIGLTNTPTYERIRRLEKKGVIKAYIAVLDKKKQGYALTVLCNVQLKSHASNYIEEFEQAIIQLKEVTDCYHIAGNYDYLLKINIQDMDGYAVFVKEKLAVIPHISTVQSSFVMRMLKEEY